MSMPSASFKNTATDGLSQQRHQSIAQTINRGIDLAEVRKALERLELLGLPKEQAAALFAQADALRALLLTENNRVHIIRGK